MNNYELVECLKCKNTFEQTALLENVICIHCDNDDIRQTVYIIQDKEERGDLWIQRKVSYKT